MTTDSTRRFVGKPKFRWTPALILSLLGLGLLGYIAVVPAYVATPEMNEASWFALTDQTVSSGSATQTSKTATETLNSQAATGVATDIVPAEDAAPAQLATLRSLD